MFTKYSPVCLCAILAVVSAYPYTTYAPIEQEHLTGWFNRDSPTGKGDFETLDEIRQENPHLLCAFPFGIECQTTSGDAYTATGQVVKCEASTGLICLNADQPAGSPCLDYRVRFRCSHPIDECASNPCLNYGVCRDRTNAFECICPEGFEGERCEINIDDCAPINPCLNGGQCIDHVARYVCDCPAGYNGLHCEIDINDCIGHRCENGATCRDLVDGYVCLCVTGYEGLFCGDNTDDCAPQPCLNNAMCQDLNNGYRCWCPPGYSGVNCETDINECDPNPCLQGNCVDGINSFTCDCNNGFRGDICQTNEDDCSPNPCIYGSCLDGFGVYFCACLPGYDGTNCDININDCSDDACMNGGTCLDAVNGYTCTCPPGYTGPICEIDINECIPEPCLNNGICVNSVNAYFCICQPGYTGLKCEIDIDDCAMGPCQNGATCVDLVANYRCDCVLGYTGDVCEISINECETYPCRNGATCLDYIGYYTCTCRPGYTGYNCETNIDECDPNPCLNGGLCLDRINDYKCICINGYTGLNCDVDIDECRSSPCENGGTCDQKTNGGYRCTCVPGYTGDRCVTDINECAPDPCENGATCIDLQNSYWCNCAPGYEGFTCGQEVDECYSQPCKNGATCIDLVNSYECICYQGYEGPNCEIAVNECDRIPCQNNGVCLDTGYGTYQCICPSEWFGDDCQYPEDKFCDHKPDGIYSHWVLCSSYISCSNSKTYRMECNPGLVFNAAGYCDYPANVPSCGSQQTVTCSGRPDGLYVDPVNCGQYIQCGGGLEYTRYCPAGLVFNENVMKCDYLHNVPRCASQLVDPFCTGKPDGSYRHPTDCAKYYICSSGGLTIASCFFNLIYNEVSKRCDFPYTTSECNQAQTGDVYCSGKQNGNYEYPGDCGKFVQCSGGASTVTICPAGLVYCIENGRCDYPPTTGRCAQAGQIGDFCLTKSTVGLYRDPSDCGKFYQCSNGETYHHSCPAGLVYNEAVEKCDYYANVPGCGEPQTVFDPFCWLKNDGLYSDPNNCNMYYRCSSKMAQHFACPHGQAFDNTQIVCTIEKYLSGCNTNGGQQPQYQWDEECLALNGYFPDNNYNKGYSVCVLGVATRLECEGNLVFNPDTKQCESVSNVPHSRQEDQLCIDRPNGRYPYPGSCIKFLKCENGYIDAVVACATGLAYNAEAQDCQAPDNTPSCFCVGRSDGSYSDPTSCYQYYSCMNEVTLRPNCSPGLTYNAAIGTCDSSPNTGPPQCTYQQQQTPDSLCDGKPNGAYGFDDKCDRYYLCHGGKHSVAVCVAGQVYNQDLKTCSLPTAVSGRCGVQQLVVIDGDFCKHKPNDHYVNPTDCNKFYQCYSGKTYPKSCQAGLVFNENKVLCDWPENVPGCF